MIYNSR